MRQIRVLIALLLCLLLPTLAAQAEELTAFTPTWENVKPLGRTHQTPDSLWLAYSGAGAEFTFHGSRAEVTILGDGSVNGAASSQVRIAIEVDGVRVVDDMIDAASKTYTVVDGDTAKDTVVRIVKLSESAMSTCGIGEIRVDAPSIAPTAKSGRRIEFIGDSITCGYGVDDENRDHHFSTETEDVTKTYAYQTAKALGADYSMVSLSGYGVVSGYTNVPGQKVESQQMPRYYGKLGYSWSWYQGSTPDRIEWDFTAFEPDVIVINLGTNDDSFVKGNPAYADEFKAGYVAFLKDIRAKNPNAKIVCTLGMMGDSLYSSVQFAMINYRKETGDMNVACVKLPVQQVSDGYAADWHPTYKTHTKAAEKLTAELKKLMAWE